MEKDKEKEKKTIPPYMTYALADRERREPASGAAIPSVTAVEAAKDWVDTNRL